MTVGRVESIGIAAAAGAPMRSIESVRAIAGGGLEGDRYFTQQGTFSATPGAVRDVTLIEAEAVEAMNAKLGTAFAARDLRRNVVTRGVALNHLVGREFHLGEARLLGTSLCQPCTYLEGLTQMGVKAAMQHRAGLRAQIVSSGDLRVGDQIVALDDPLELNKELIRRYYDEMWNPWNFAKADELLADDIVFRGSLGTETRGRAQFCDYMCSVQLAFPDFHNTIEELVAEEDRVVARLRYTGSHCGAIFGVPPTGNAISYSGAAFFRIAHGQVGEGWVLGDLITLLHQLGAKSVP